MTRARSIICDFCGRTHYEYGFAYVADKNAGEWLHHYETGKDECAVCQEKRRKAEGDAMWAKIRADMGLNTEATKPAISEKEGT